jgi:hypothetical protein
MYSPKTPDSEIQEIGGEPLKGSGFEPEEPEATSDDVAEGGLPR